MAARLTPQQRQYRLIKERDWQATVEALARARGWLVYHAPDNRPILGRNGKPFIQNVRAGFPDLVMVRDKDGASRLVFAELKRELGTVSEEQKSWALALSLCGAEVYLWRPSDLQRVIECLA